MTLVLGVDAGGTHTRAAIADGSGRVVGEGIASGGNLDDAGPEGAAAAIGAATRDASGAAGIGAPVFDAAFLGVAGVVSDADRSALLAAVDPLLLAPAHRVVVDHDCRVALAGGLSGRPGIVLIAGTGSAAFGVDADGRRWRAGGWGPILGDEGSGYRLALDGLGAVARAADGRGPETTLTELLLDALDAASADDLLHRIHLEGRGRADIAALAPLVVSEATAGDPVASAALERSLDGLADLVMAVRRNLSFGTAVEVVHVGGLFDAGDAVLPALRARLGHPDRVRLLAPERTPAEGACILASEILADHSANPLG